MSRSIISECVVSVAPSSCLALKFQTFRGEKCGIEKVVGVSLPSSWLICTGSLARFLLGTAAVSFNLLSFDETAKFGWVNWTITFKAREEFCNKLSNSFPEEGHILERLTILMLWAWTPAATGRKSENGWRVEVRKYRCKSWRERERERGGGRGGGSRER